MNAIATISFDNLVQMHNQEVTTTSKIVAETFEKQHKHVLAKIDEIIAETPVEFNELNFKPIQIETNLGLNRTRLDRAYEMTKDGFMLLVMGFTGKKAMEIKIKFIEAFNWAFDKLQKSTSKQREVLIRACEKLSVGKMARPQAYALVANQFGYEKPIDIPVSLIPEATEFAYEMILRLKPTQSSEPTTPQETNEVKMFWKCVGLNQYHETGKHLDQLLKTLHKAEDQLRQVNKSRSLIYDALAEPKHPVGGQEKVQEINQKALAFIQRQNAMKV